MYVSTLPIASSSDAEKNAIERLVSYILYLADEASLNLSDKLMLNYFEQLINGLIYELYLSEDLKAQNCIFIEYFQSEHLPVIENIKGNKLNELRSVFERLHAPDHPLRENLYFLETIPVVRLIEGKA